MNIKMPSNDEVKTLLNNPAARDMFVRVQKMISESKSYGELMGYIQTFIDSAPKSKEGDAVRDVLLDWQNQCQNAIRHGKIKTDDWSQVASFETNYLDYYLKPTNGTK